MRSYGTVLLLSLCVVFGVTRPVWAQDTPNETDRGEPEPADRDVENIVVVGSHSGRARTVTDSPVAVDVIDMRDINQQAGQWDINQLLQYAAPSFNASKQSGADGADHIDPATLRGLGPDQTLVLVNGKRRHQSSLINIYGTRGRGNTGTDLNSIPMSAIERIEILRDGASALYGSDAIAGVVNIVLKEKTDTLDVNLNTGMHYAQPPSSLARKDTTFDGESVQINGNLGAKLGQDGFVNFTVDYLTKQRTNRPVDPDAGMEMYRNQFGDAALDNFGVVVNASLPLSDDTSLYSFGSYNYRHVDAYAWTREPGEHARNVAAIYPDGFDPHITSGITDTSVSAGFKSALGAWSLDCNNTFGVNRFHYFIEGTLNASLLEKSPTRFDAGGHQLSQNTTSLNLTRSIPSSLTGIHVSMGGEYRLENFVIFAGEEASYRNYGIMPVIENGEIVNQDLLGKAGGSQGFPGFQPGNEVDEYRSNVSAYLDAEFDFTKDFMASAAARFERYSDFGNTINAKIASRLDLVDLLGLEYQLDRLAVRMSVSTGFRAPSLAQIHYNTTITDFEGGVAKDKIIAKNISPITRTLGIAPLKEETSTNLSVGVVAKLADLSITADYYYIQIKDRIVLTGDFSSSDPDIGPELDALGVSAAQFFTNALDTKTTGFDVILVYKLLSGDVDFSVSVLYNNNHMDLGAIKTSPKLAGKEDNYFGLRDQRFLLASAPENKYGLSLDYRSRWFFGNVRVTLFDDIRLIDWGGSVDHYRDNWTLDASLGAELADDITLVVGALNVLNKYPTTQDMDTETGGLWDAVQMGFSGTFLYAKLNLKI